MNNKTMIKNIARLSVAFLLVIMAILAFFSPLYSVKVSIRNSLQTPYDTRVNYSGVSIYSDLKKYNSMLKSDKDIDDYSKSEQAKLMYVRATDMNDSTAYGINVFNTASFTESDYGMSEVSKLAVYLVLFLLGAALVGFIGNKPSYVYSMIVSVLFIIKLITTGLNITSRTVYNVEYGISTYTFYNFKTAAGYVLGLMLLTIIIIICAFAIGLSKSKAVSYAGGKNDAAAFQAPVSADVFPKPSVSHSLTCAAGELRGGDFSMTPGEQVVIGRDSNVANIVVVAPKISRKHCVIRYDAATNSYFVTDYSTNGTFNASNGQRLTYGVEISLPCGTLLSLGNNDNQFRLN